MADKYYDDEENGWDYDVYGDTHNRKGKKEDGKYQS